MGVRKVRGGMGCDNYINHCPVGSIFAFILLRGVQGLVSTSAQLSIASSQLQTLDIHQLQFGLRLTQLKLNLEPLKLVSK